MAANEDLEQDGINKELVVAYLMGELSTAEQLDFRQDMQRNPALAAYTASMEMIINTLKEGLIEDAGKDALQATLENNRKAFFRKQRTLPRIAYFAAAAALFAAILLIWPKQHSLNNEWKQISMMSFTERGNLTDSLLITASQKFNAQDFPEALALLNKVIATAPNNQTALFYRGIAAYMTKNTAQARKDLELVATGSSIFQEEAMYYLALMYATEKDKSTALEWLNKIPSGSPMSEKAAKLKQRM